jgi:DNA-binding FrmR family transcriptional regulator
MVEEDSYCCDVLNQLNAVRSALDQASAAIAANHIRHCVVGHDEGEGHEKALRMTKEELLDELQDVLGKLVK